jgi:dCMP deaminase
MSSLSAEDRNFLLEALASREESHDPDRQVGVVIVDAGGRLVARDANRPPAALGLSVEQSHDAINANAEWKYFVIEHAERNAIRKAQSLGYSLKGATIYATLFPCADCARAIVDAGFSRLVVLSPDYLGRDEKWLLHHLYSNEIFKLAKIKVDIAPLRDLTSVVVSAES